VNRRALVAVVVFLGVAGAGVLFVGGSDLGGDFGGSDATDAPSATVSSQTTVAESASDTVRETNEQNDETPPTTTTDSEYAFTIERVENCGNTCRDVTARLTNSGGEPRENVRVATTVLADGEMLWSGNETVGTLASGQSHVSTERVEVGFSGGLQLRANDGYVTIVTEVRSENGTTRFSERRKVA
jgi:hypothetical protein